MNRRGFIQSFMGAAAMAVVPDNDGVSLTSMKHPTFIPGKDLTRMVDEMSGEVGFGLAPAKMEGASIPYDQGLRAEFPKALKEGLSKAFGDHYDMEPDSFEELWIDIDDGSQKA